jgi:hypothetical protein
MIVVRPRQGEKIPVTADELKTINAVVDQSAHKWSKPDYIADLFRSANQGSGAWVFLRSEGWHQKERYNGEFYKHVTVHYLGWTYHMYTKVKSDIEEIVPGAHTIDYISYQGDKGTMNLKSTS